MPVCKWTIEVAAARRKRHAEKTAARYHDLHTFAPNVNHPHSRDLAKKKSQAAKPAHQVLDKEAKVRQKKLLEKQAATIAVLPFKPDIGINQRQPMETPDWVHRLAVVDAQKSQENVNFSRTNTELR